MESIALKSQATNYLIIGSNGFIGSRLASTLQEQMRASGFKAKEYIYSSSNYANANLATLASDRNASTVVFCGGIGGFRLSAESALSQEAQYEYFVRECSRFSSIKRFFLLSSLGAAASRMPSPYKDLCMCKEQATTSSMGAKGVSIRLPSIYGYDPFSGIHKGLPGVIAYGLMTNQVIKVYGELNTTRNYISIQSASEALSSIITRDGKGSKASGLINLANSYNMTVHQILNIIGASLRGSPRLQLVQTRALDVESHDPSVVDGSIDYINSDLRHWSRMIYSGI